MKCKEKKFYLTFKDAENKRKELFDKKLRFLRSYKCSNCNFYHLTSQIKKTAINNLFENLNKMNQNRIILKQMQENFEKSGLLFNLDDFQKKIITQKFIEGCEILESNKKNFNNELIFEGFLPLIRLAFDAKINFTVNNLFEDYKNFILKKKMKKKDLSHELLKDFISSLKSS
jgi:hypothetical protein